MWLDRAVRWLLPREDHFFDQLERGAECASRCGALLVECCSATGYANREIVVKKLNEEEHVADKVIMDVYESLNKTFVTPFDRSDIYALATELENITDCINSTASHIIVHAMEDVPDGSQQLSLQIREAVETLQAAVQLLRSPRNYSQIRPLCEKVNALESAGDSVFRSRIGEMFKTEKDAIRLLKHKEFLEGLERTLDKCDDVANVLENIVIKNG